MHETGVVVIGAGAAGVAAARRLADARVPAVLMEARGRVGGRAWTRHVGDLALDLGCGWLHSADENELAAMAPQLGFPVDGSPPPWSRPAYDGNFSAAEQKDYWAAWERFYARVDAAAAEERDRPMSDCFEAGCRWNAMLGAMITYINGAEAEKISLREYALYHDSGVNRRVRKGYGALIEAYAAGLDIHLDSPVTLVDHSGARLRIVTPRGDIAARAAVIAVPPGVMANETLRFAPALTGKLDAAQLPLGVADKVFLRLARADDLPSDTRLAGSTTTRETGSYTLRPFGRPVIEGYFGGEFARSLEHEGDRALAAFAIEQIANALGSGMRARLQPIAASAWARDPFSLGSYSYGNPGARAMRAALAAPVAGRLFFAGEHCSAADFSTAHGAYRSGVTAADEAIKVLQAQPV
ncbi:MAG: FAD-dependent oxidoreductase [Alphaproteobacteria bacterium]|nr:MAG: FAD-dependent oxidoreductase [Alphaproteobacteria bacterium]